MGPLGILLRKWWILIDVNLCSTGALFKRQSDTVGLVFNGLVNSFQGTGRLVRVLLLC